jgi:hypothetical protein
MILSSLKFLLNWIKFVSPKELKKVKQEKVFDCSVI